MLREFSKNYLLRTLYAQSVHRNIRGWLQDTQASRNLARHRRIVNRSGKMPPCDIGELQTLLRQRIQLRSTIKTPKKVGDLHVYLAYQVWDWEYVLPTALEPFGKVTSFDYRARGYDENCSGWTLVRPRMNAEMLEAFEKANAEQPVDAVVGYLSGHNTHPDVLRQMSHSGAAVFNFCWDDKLNYPGKEIGGVYETTAGIASAVDLNLTNASESVIKYWAYGGLAMFWPEAAHPEIHKQLNLPFEYDVSFVGACYGWRPFLINGLRKHGIKVQCWGRGWPNGTLPSSEMGSIFCKSRINLGFSTIGYSRKLMCLKGRDFEIPMTGSLYLTQHNPELEAVFQIGKEILTYHGLEDCAQKIRHVLANSDESDDIRKAGRARCLRDHTYFSRWQQVFRLAGILE